MGKRLPFKQNTKFPVRKTLNVKNLNAQMIELILQNSDDITPNIIEKINTKKVSIATIETTTEIPQIPPIAQTTIEIALKAPLDTPAKVEEPPASSSTSTTIIEMAPPALLIKLDSGMLKAYDRALNKEEISETSSYTSSLISRQEDLEKKVDFSTKNFLANIRLKTLGSNRNTLKKVNTLRYRENVFRAASRLAKEMPSYPDWTYRDEELKYLDIIKIDVGGRIFHILKETLLNLEHTKLAICIKNHKCDGIPFFDRDPICFSAVLQFYRTGRLHLPPNICMSLFNEEIEFWGIHEGFIEPCCWSYYNKFKDAGNTLKKYCEDIKRSENFKCVSKNLLVKWRMTIYSMMILGSGSVISRWLSLICTMCIILSILSIIMSASPLVRIDKKTKDLAIYKENELVSNYLMRTNMAPIYSLGELIITGYFLSEFMIRLCLCPDKLEFFSDTLNWIDMMATITSLISAKALWANPKGPLEGYLLILKLPRILRLFKLTSNLRNGMEAFILTLRASAKELKLVFFILLIATVSFGSLLFVIEMINETPLNKSQIHNIYLGMWLAIVTMSTVGYGDIHIKTPTGYLFGTVCIMCGVIICQLPVPIFLQSFRVFYNQANARFNLITKITVRHTDPEALYLKADKEAKNLLPKPRKFNKLFNLVD